MAKEGGTVEAVAAHPVNGSADGSSGKGSAHAAGLPSRSYARQVSVNVVAAFRGSPDTRFPCGRRGKRRNGRGEEMELEEVAGVVYACEDGHG